MAIKCTMRLSDESQARIATLYADTQRMVDTVSTLSRSEVDLIQPLLESLLGILTNLSDCLITVEGDVEFEAAEQGQVEF